jgi:hypothetical protein
MRKEIRRVDPQRGIVQVTTEDSRFYCREIDNPDTGLPEIVWRPSVTWISDYYPKGRGFEHWLKKWGDDADQIARLAAERGFKVHRAIALLNEGETINMADAYDTGNGTQEPLTADEYFAVMTYCDWWQQEGIGKLEILKAEYTVWPDEQACAEKYEMPAYLFKFAGTVDLKVRRIEDDTQGIIDFKTSLDIWPSHEMQVSAYRKAEGADWAAILQLNYRRNKTKKFKFTVIPDRFGLFCATHQIWANEVGGLEPLQRDFPLELKLEGVAK